MQKVLTTVLSIFMAVIPVAADSEKETDRIEESGQVMREIVNIPDNIPKDLLDRAECVIVLPSVKKLAIGIGGSYGRGVMTCRTGAHFTGPWSAPALYALEGGNIGFQLGGQATDFVLLVMNPRGAGSLMGSKVKLGVGCRAEPKGRTATGDRRCHACRDSFLLAFARVVRRHFAGRIHLASRQSRKWKTLWKKIECKRDCPARKSWHSRIGG
jgi:lipid-binding SYLF domain-containing protein